jgi:hypothetical protein
MRGPKPARQRALGQIQLVCQEIAVSEEQESVPAIQQALLRAPPAEAQALMGWARGLSVIRVGELRGRSKMAAQFALLRETKAAWPLVKVMGRALKVIVWDARSWKFRLGLGAVIATFVAVGNAGAGMVALGGGIRLPLCVLIGGGGLLLGLIVDQVRKRISGR